MNLRLVPLPLALAFVAAGCATTGYDDARDAQKLALYRAHAIEQVGHIPFSGSVDRWNSLGDTALAVWTSPGRAYLLELRAACPHLDTSYGIGFDSNDGQIDAGFDSVVPLSQPGVSIPCRIDSIHRIDVDGLRAAERAADAYSGM